MIGNRGWGYGWRKEGACMNFEYMNFFEKNWSSDFGGAGGWGNGMGSRGGK